MSMIDSFKRTEDELKGSQEERDVVERAATAERGPHRVERK